MRYESTLPGARRRLLQLIALHGPGAEGARVWLHRKRGVKIGEGCFIGTAVMIETAFPHLVEIGDGVDIGMRTTIVAHQQESSRTRTSPRSASRTTSSSARAASCFPTSPSARALW